MKKLIEIHLGHVGKNDVDANLDIYIEASETSGLYDSYMIKAMFLSRYFEVINQTTACDKDTVSTVLDSNVTEGENIAELFREYIETHPTTETKQRLNSLYGINIDLESGYPDTDAVKPEVDKIEHMKLVAYSADGELTAMGENPNVHEMADHINGTIATLCRQAEKITGKDMSYYAETAEIESELYRDMHPLTAYQLMRETYLKFAEILIAICKDYEAENEEWL